MNPIGGGRVERPLSIHPSSARTAVRVWSGLRRVGLLSTYPPTQCGLASFAAALRDSLVAASPGTEVGVVRMVDEEPASSRSEVVYELTAGVRGDTATAAAWLNRFDVVLVQHEYGIFGGPDGEQVLAVLDRIRVPVVVVLHTVLSTPTTGQRRVLERLVAAADRVVTLSRTGYLRLCSGYQVDVRKIVVIPHGAWPGIGMLPPAADRSSRPIVLTWGLLGPGKGVEWGVAALATLRALDPLPLYVVAGQTHPRVLARDGEQYREMLCRQAAAIDVTHMLRFEPGYLDRNTLRRLVARADVVLLPYDSHEQVTSGVLIEAVAALTPVVSTAFPHARELLANGAGVLVPHGDPAAIGAALRRVLTEPANAAAMVAAAARIAPTLGWPAIAGQYLQIAGALVAHRTEVA
jgi:glycosyltransferase involved in cell wall biosynthesis